jgi:transcriptional regulator with XRE-family HTH domain
LFYLKRIDEKRRKKDTNRLEVKLKQKELANLSGISYQKISRMCRDSNDRKSTYNLKLNDVLAVILTLNAQGAFDFPEDEGMELLYTAFPHLTLFQDFLKKRVGVPRADTILIDKGYKPFGKYE